METVALIVIGAAALGYMGYVIRRGLRGKAACICGENGPCKESGQGCCFGKKTDKAGERRRLP